MPGRLVVRVPQGEFTGINSGSICTYYEYSVLLRVGIAGARGQRQSSDYYLDTPSIGIVTYTIR